jgi:NADH-quinone oxidoreductase subunit J
VDGFGVTLAFWVLAALTLGAAGGVMAARNLLHAILSLIVTFLGIAGFFVLLSADFLAMAQIVIYVGAISVLVLFAVFLTPRAGRDNGETKMAAPAAMLAVVLAALFLFVIYDSNWGRAGETPEPGLSAASLGEALLTTWTLPFILASVLLTAALIGAIMLVRSQAEEAEDLAA